MSFLLSRWLKIVNVNDIMNFLYSCNLNFHCSCSFRISGEWVFWSQYMIIKFYLFTRDQIANILCIIKKAREFQKNIYFCFIDYAKAFDCVDHKKLWNILKEMGIPDHLTCLLRNLYAGQEATVRTGHGTTDWFQIGKGVRQGCILSPCLFNLYAEYIMRNAGLKEAQTGIKTAGINQ